MRFSGFLLLQGACETAQGACETLRIPRERIGPVTRAREPRHFLQATFRACLACMSAVLDLVAPRDQSWAPNCMAVGIISYLAALKSSLATHWIAKISQSGWPSWYFGSEASRGLLVRSFESSGEPIGNRWYIVHCCMCSAVLHHCTLGTGKRSPAGQGLSAQLSCSPELQGRCSC